MGTITIFRVAMQKKHTNWFSNDSETCFWLQGVSDSGSAQQRVIMSELPGDTGRAATWPQDALTWAAAEV